MAPWIKPRSRLHSSRSLCRPQGWLPKPSAKGAALNSRRAGNVAPAGLGVRPRPGRTWYNGSKGAVIIVSKSLAAELGADNIRVNCVNPVMNPYTGLGTAFAGGELTPERLDKFRSTIPLGRFSSPEDVANATLYLASDEAAFISGVCLEVDGGRCA